MRAVAIQPRELWLRYGTISVAEATDVTRNYPAAVRETALAVPDEGSPGAWRRTVPERRGSGRSSVSRIAG